MKAASIFSGIGAPESAWLPLGFEFVFNAEIEPFPCAMLKHHYPETENLGDVTNYEQWPDRHFHVLVGGSPCQSFSVAGLRKGLDDPRGNLMLTFGAITARYRPDWFVWENVPGVLSSNGGRDFACFLGLLTGQVVEPPADGWENSGILSGINSAYGVAWRILDAQYFGVAQRRRRVFVVGHIGGKWQRATAVLFERESLCGNPPPSRKKREGIAPEISARTKGGGGLGTDFDCDDGLVTPTLTCEGDAHSGFRDEHGILAHALRADGFDASEDGTGRGTPLVVGSLTSKGPAANGAPEVDGGHYIPQICGTISDGAHQGGGLNGQDAYSGRIINTTSVRRLTPVECSRLQGFPDDFTLIPIKTRASGKVNYSKDGPRYKALGNSMAVPVLRWIGQRIISVNQIP